MTTGIILKEKPNCPSYPVFCENNKGHEKELVNSFWSPTENYVGKQNILNLIFITFYIYSLLETGFFCSFGACPEASSYRPGRPQTHRDPSASTS